MHQTKAKQEVPSGRYSQYLLSHEEALMRNIYLMGITKAMCQQQTRQPLQPSNLNNPKVVWFLLYHSLKHMMPQQDFTKAFEGWYPPRTVSDQLEFKKVCVAQIQKLQVQGRVPRNFMINKAVLDQMDRIVEFLRYLTEFALRALYLQSYTEPLVQVSLKQSASDREQNKSSYQDINRFYPHLMTPEPPEIPQQTLECLAAHIDIQKKKLLEKRTHRQCPQFPQDELMNNLYYLQQIKKKLNTNIPRDFFSENRAFDRTQLLDKCSAVWKELDVDLDQDLQLGQNQVLESDGEWFELDVHWEKWLGTLKKRVNDIHNKSVADTCSNRDPIKQLTSMKEQLKKDIQGLEAFRQEVRSSLQADK